MIGKFLRLKIVTSALQADLVSRGFNILVNKKKGEYYGNEIL